MNDDDNWVSEEVDGEIVEQWNSPEYGMECGTVECPRCHEQIHVKPASRSQCRCGLEWSIEVRAVGWRQYQA
jgi:hypothetical protein